MIRIIKKFNRLLEKKEKRGAWLLLLIATVGAFFEMLGVSLMVPLITAIMKPEIVTENAIIARVCAALGITDHRGFIVLCIIAMLAVYIVKALFLVFRNSYTRRYVYQSRYRMQQKVFRAFLKKPYEYYLNAQSGEILRVVRSDVYNTYSLLNMLLSLISESIVSLAIIAVVIWINPLMTLLIAVVISIIFVIVLKVVKPVMREEGIRYNKSVSKAYKWLLQAIQGIKEIKVAGREGFFEDNFEQASIEQVESEKRYAIISGLPRIIIELGCIASALIAMLIMVLVGNELQMIVPAFSAFAMAAVKLMPAFSSVMNSVNAVSYYEPSVDRLIESLGEIKEMEETEDTVGKEITFTDKIELKDITFRYKPESTVILEHASMVIPSGHAIGISGISGAGKTTSVDILLGLLKPENGEILCDGVNILENYRGWLEQVAYIPQSIFLLDSTIRENVIFGSDIADDDKVWDVLEDAKLADFVKEQPDLLNTEIGERGIRLSGGQRQRIGIARALYNNPKLLILDEATASLDTETETAIMDAIHSLQGKTTMIIIAHRKETIKNCDMVYRVQDKRIILESDGK